MADNVAAEQVVTPGATFATDNIDDVHHPYVKVEFGADNTAIRVADAAGERLPVKVGESILPSGAATETTLGNVATAAGAPADAEATGNGTIIAILKRIRTLLGGTLTVAGTVTANLGTIAGVATDTVLQAVRDRLPSSLTGSGNLKVALVESTVTQPVSGTVTANAGTGTFTVSGTVTDGGSSKTLKTAVVALTATGDVVAAVASKRIRVYAYGIQSRNDSMTVQFRDGSAGSLLGARWAFNVHEGVMGSAVNPPAWLMQTSAGNALRAVITGTGTVDIEVRYWDDDA